MLLNQERTESLSSIPCEHCWVMTKMSGLGKRYPNSRLRAWFTCRIGPPESGLFVTLRNITPVLITLVFTALRVWNEGDSIMVGTRKVWRFSQIVNCFKDSVVPPKLESFVIQTSITMLVSWPSPWTASQGSSKACAIGSSSDPPSDGQSLLTTVICKH